MQSKFKIYIYFEKLHRLVNVIKNALLAYLQINLSSNLIIWNTSYKVFYFIWSQLNTDLWFFKCWNLFSWHPCASPILQNHFHVLITKLGWNKLCKHQYNFIQNVSQIWQAQFPNGGSFLGSSQFSILPQLPLKILLDSKMFKINPKIIILHC